MPISLGDENSTLGGLTATPTSHVQDASFDVDPRDLKLFGLRQKAATLPHFTALLKIIQRRDNLHATLPTLPLIAWQPSAEPNG